MLASIQEYSDIRIVVDSSLMLASVTQEAKSIPDNTKHIF